MDGTEGMAKRRGSRGLGSESKRKQKGPLMIKSARTIVLYLCGLKGEGGSIWAERSPTKVGFMATSGPVAIELPQWLR